MITDSLPRKMPSTILLAGVILLWERGVLSGGGGYLSRQYYGADAKMIAIARLFVGMRKATVSATVNGCILFMK